MFRKHVDSIVIVVDDLLLTVYYLVGFYYLFAFTPNNYVALLLLLIGAMFPSISYLLFISVIILNLWLSLIFMYLMPIL